MIDRDNFLIGLGALAVTPLALVYWLTPIWMVCEIAESMIIAHRHREMDRAS